MAHLLSRNRLNLISLVLLVSAMLIMIGMMLPDLKHLQDESWVETASLILQFLGLFGVVGTAIYIERSGPTSIDLLRALEKTRVEEDRVMKAWSTVREKELTFREMSTKRKLMYVTFLFFGVAFPVYGVFDILGAIPEIQMSGGEIIPGWVSGSFTIFLGIFIFGTSFILRYTFVDEDGEARRLREKFRLLDGGKDDVN